MPGVERGRAEVALRRNDLRIEGLPTDGKVWRVVWYCGIHRNFLAPSEPRVAVLLISGGSGHYEHRVVNVGLTNLGLVEIGSRWTNGRYVDSAKTSVFDVVVDSATQRQFAPKFIRRLARVSDPSCLPYLGHQTAMLVEAAESDTVVVFPSLELFSRCFGSSQYVKRTLATLPFDEAYRQLTAPDRIPPDALAPGHQLVTLNKRCYDSDGPFVAGLKYDVYAQSSLRQFCGSLQAFDDKRPEAIVAPTVMMWWDEPIRMLLRGIVLDSTDGRRYILSYRVLGMDGVSGEPLIIDRENTNRTLEPNSDESRQSRVRERSASRSRPEPVPRDLVNTQEPSPEFEPERVVEEPFRMLSQKRVRLLARTAKPRSDVTSVTASEAGAEGISGADYGGEIAKVAVAFIRYEVVNEPNDRLSAHVWNALNKISNDAPKNLQTTVDIWTGQRFQYFTRTFPLRMIDYSEGDAARWSIIKNASRDRSRCFCVARMTIDGKSVCFLDVERRTKDGDETEKLGGIAFLLSEGGAVVSTLNYIVNNIIKVSGTMSKVKPPSIDLLPYKHRREDASMQRTLRKVILQLTRVDTTPPKPGDNDAGSSRSTLGSSSEITYRPSAPDYTAPQEPPKCSSERDLGVDADHSERRRHPVEVLYLGSPHGHPS